MTVVGGALCLILRLVAMAAGALDSSGVAPSGTILTVHLARPLTSRDTRLGDVFEALVVSVTATNGGSVIPPGALVEGRCVAVRAGESEARPGYLRLVLSGLQVPHGSSVPLETTTFSQWGNSVFEVGRDSPQTPDPDGGAKRRVSSGANSNDAVVAPEARLTFVLLEPVEVKSRLWQP